MENEIDAAMVSDLYLSASYWHEPGVISADAGGWHTVEPGPVAEAAGRRVVCTQGWLDHRFSGRPLGADEFILAARELNASEVPDAR